MSAGPPVQASTDNDVERKHMSGASASLAEWRKSSYCDTNTCVEIMITSDTVYIRDGKDPDGGRLRLGSDAFAAFVADIKAGHFPANA
jgi:hypothetical protein